MCGHGLSYHASSFVSRLREVVNVSIHVLRGVESERAGWSALSQTKVPIDKRYMYARLTQSEVCLFWRKEKKKKSTPGTDTPPMSFPFLRSPCPHPARLVPSWWRPPISNSNHPPPARIKPFRLKPLRLSPFRVPFHAPLFPLL